MTESISGIPAPESLPQGQVVAFNPSLVGRVGEDVSSLYHEAFDTQEGRIKRVAAGIGAAAMQTADRVRGLAFVLPPVFHRVLRYSAEHGFNGLEQATLSGVAVAGAFNVWSNVVGKTFDVGMEQFPKTTELVARNHPVMVEVIDKAIGGFPSKEELRAKQLEKPTEGYDVSPYETASSLPGAALVAQKRAPKVALLYGSTAYVGVSRLRGFSQKSTNRIRRAVSNNGSLFFGELAAGVSALITNSKPEVAQRVESVLENKLVWSVAALGLTGLTALSTKLARNKEAKLMKSTPSQDGQSIMQTDY